MSLSLSNTQEINMTYYINITLEPKNQHRVHLGDTPCEWSKNNLEFLDAPYGFYEFIDEALGYDEALYTARTKFLLAFFDALNKQIRTLGFRDELEFNVNMPIKFFGVCFSILIFEGE